LFPTRGQATIASVPKDETHRELEKNLEELLGQPVELLFLGGGAPGSGTQDVGQVGPTGDPEKLATNPALGHRADMDLPQAEASPTRKRRRWFSGSRRRRAITGATGLATVGLYFGGFPHSDPRAAMAFGAAALGGTFTSMVLSKARGGKRADE